MQWTEEHGKDCLTQFIVLRLVRKDEGATYKTVAVYKPTFQPSYWLFYEALVSPGENQFLLRPSKILYNRFRDQIPKVKDNKHNHVSVINIQPGGSRPHTTATRQRSWSICGSDLQRGQGQDTDNRGQGLPLHVPDCIHKKDIFHDNSHDFVYAYDPRFQRNRLAVGGYNSDHIYLYDLAQEGVICESKSQPMARLVFSPDGRFLIGLVGYFQITEKESVITNGVVLYNSDSLEILERIDYSAVGPVAIAAHKSYLLPEFSSNGAYIAVPKIPSSEHSPLLRVAVYTVPFEVNLMKLCRFYILRYVCITDIYKLALPTPLKNFLLFRPYTYQNYTDTFSS